MTKAQHTIKKTKVTKQDFESIIHNPVFAEHLLERLNKSGMIVINSAGECIYVSSRAEQILDKQKEEIIGQSFFEAIPLLTIEKEAIVDRKHPVWRALQSEIYTQVTPFFCTPKGVDGHSLAMNVMQIQKDSKLMAVVVQIRKAEREVNLGEMKSLFVSFAAHQLKTPSSIVKGFLELMMREGKEAYTDDQWNYLISAFESNEHLIQVSKSLLSMARLEGGLIEPQIREFHPAKLLRTKIISLSALFDLKNLKVECEGDDSDYVNTDDNFFLEIFEIILANAIKHSPPKSKIKVKCIANDDGVTIHVIDQGPGVPESAKKGLFLEAKDTESTSNSHGLGLYMAKKYLSLLGGTIGVVSDKNGSDFYFSVPNAN